MQVFTNPNHFQKAEHALIVTTQTTNLLHMNKQREFILSLPQYQDFLFGSFFLSAYVLATLSFLQRSLLHGYAKVLLSFGVVVLSTLVAIHITFVLVRSPLLHLLFLFFDHFSVPPTTASSSSMQTEQRKNSRTICTKNRITEFKVITEEQEPIHRQSLSANRKYVMTYFIQKRCVKHSPEIVIYVMDKRFSILSSLFNLYSCMIRKL